MKKSVKSLFARTHESHAWCGAAPSPLHTPVNDLHFVEFKAHTKPLFLLT